MKKIIIALLIVFLPIYLLPQESETIKEVLEKSYVEGIHINRDVNAVKNGFHKDFLMHVFSNGQVIKASLDMWLDRMQLDGTKNPKSIEYEFDQVQVTGNSAMVKMKIFEDSKLLYTDYLGLYKFENGWKIVNKIFYSYN